jgi:hypothetical protein
MSDPLIPFQSDHFRLYQLADGVFAAIALNGGAAISNAGIIDLGDRTLIFDTFISPSGCAGSAPRRRMAIWLGLLLFVVGGLGPYLEITFRTMPLGFNLATLAEIFLQNFLTGIVAMNMFKPGSALGRTAAAASRQ